MDRGDAGTKFLSKVGISPLVSEIFIVIDKNPVRYKLRAAKSFFNSTSVSLPICLRIFPSGKQRPAMETRRYWYFCCPSRCDRSALAVIKKLARAAARTGGSTALAVGFGPNDAATAGIRNRHRLRPTGKEDSSHQTQAGNEKRTEKEKLHQYTAASHLATLRG